MNLFDWDRGKADLPYANAEHADRIMRLSVVRKIYSPPAVLNIRGPKFPVGGVDGGDSPIFTGWALDDGGRPSVIVRRSAKGEYVGKAKFRNGSIPKILRDYFGYPGTDRMVWEFRLNMDEFNRADGKSPSVGGRTTLYFFARDRLGRETLIGVRSQHLKN